MPISDLALLSADIQSYVVAPLALFGIGGFVFDVDDEETARLSADITDHYTEDNLAVQDHIARKPRSITLKGFVGEVVYNGGAESNDSILQQLPQKLSIVSDFLPQITAATQQVQNFVQSGKDIRDIKLADAADIYGLVKNLLGTITSDTPRQQQAFLYFKSCWEQGIVMAIQTPWEFLTNMTIEDIIAIRPPQSKYITDFSIRFKQLRFAQTTSAAYNAAGPNTSSSSDNVLGYAGNYPPIVPVTSPGLDGDAALQAPNPVPIGNVPGLNLPSNQLPGGQSQMSVIDDLSPVANQEALRIYRQENGLPTPPIDIELGLDKIYVPPLPH